MKIPAQGFVILFCAVTAVGAQDYIAQYSRGSLAVGIGNCDEGETLLQEAIKLNPKDDFRKNYFPHFYLAVCALNRNDLELAKKLSKQAEGAGISFSPLAKEYSKFKGQLQAKFKEPKQLRMVLAVVVNSENPLKDISLEDLRKIYTGEKKTWENGSPVVPVMGPEGSTENRTFLSTVCSTDEKGLKTLWTSLKAAPPSMIEKNEWILRFVFTNPGAIAFYPSDASMQQVKVIRVEGKEPTDPAYPVASR